MSKKKPFVYTPNQQFLHSINNRIRGLTVEVNMGKHYEGELQRMQEAWADVRGKMSDEEFAAFDAHENRVLTPAELAAETARIAKAMEENKDKVSI